MSKAPEKGDRKSPEKGDWVLDFYGEIDYSKNMEDTKRIERKIFSFIQEHHMLTPGEGVVAGVSGGADSVCLLFVLSKWAAENGSPVYVVHVDHGIRREAGRDAAYVERLCGELGVPFILVRRDVRKEAEERKCSEEEMGRILRYEAFEQAARQTGAGKIAVAHNGNDQAETMLFHLFRGSGLTGLGGIRPVRGRIVRPLLCLERREIEAYLEEKGIAYCRDCTNEGDDYARNRIRHHIIPYAGEWIAGGCVSHMGRTAQELQELEEYLREQTQRAYGQVVRKAPEGEEVCFILDRVAFLSYSPVIGKRLILEVLKRLSPGGKDISRAHIEAVMGLFSREGNGETSLPYHILARRQYETVMLERREQKEQRASVCVQVDRTSLSMEETLVSLEGDLVLGLSLLNLKKNENIPKKKYTKWFDYDKINKPLTIRTRETGDYLTLQGQGQEQIHQSLSRYMKNEKIPVEERERILLLTEGQHVLWALGYRISEFYKVCEDTGLILQVRLLRRRGESFMEMEE